MRARWAWLSLLLIVSAARPASAEPPAETHFRQGLKHYQAGEYARAARAFSRAYRLEKRPTYLFGWAQSERLRGRCGAAVALFEEFLTLSPSPQDVVAAR